MSLDQGDEAIRAFEACLRLDPLYLDVYERISRVYFRRDEHQKELAISSVSRERKRDLRRQAKLSAMRQ